MALGRASSGEAGNEPVQRYPATAVIRFNGTSTLHDFGGELGTQPFVLIVSNGTWSASAAVLSGQMATASEGRDRNMHRMLATNEYPEIRGTVANAPIPNGKAPATNVILQLKIRDSNPRVAGGCPGMGGIAREHSISGGVAGIPEAIWAEGALGDGRCSGG
jgi:hypothetical protein